MSAYRTSVFPALLRVGLTIVSIHLFTSCTPPTTMEEPGQLDITNTLTLAPTPILDAEEIIPAPLRAEVMIEVQGAVARPGFYKVSDGARVQDGIDAAGGPVAGAEIRDLNIAAKLHDGSVLSVPYMADHNRQLQATAAQLNTPAYTRSGWRGGDTAPSRSGSRDSANSKGTCINLNTATQQALETLPGVGPKTAEKIIRYREQQPFSTVDELRNVQGVGDKRLESWRALVCI